MSVNKPASKPRITRAAGTPAIAATMKLSE